MGHPQVVSIGNNTSAQLILNTGAPQGCMLSPLLYSLFTHDCMARYDSNTIIKFYQRRIPKQLIVAYEMTRSDCTHKGVMLITKKNYPICANPDEPLIDRIMKAIDESKFK
uniref:Chemokine interleukin-8-like domain-containing protein n=1 Tax=Salmo trutta TaxID=8032 RepID=A0A674B8C2_SALTR